MTAAEATHAEHAEPNYILIWVYLLILTVAEVAVVYIPMPKPIMVTLLVSMALAKAALVGSPGTYDQKHLARIAGVRHCVAYGPGPLEEAHQPDESCSVDDLVASAQVMALAALELVG